MTHIHLLITQIPILTIYFTVAGMQFVALFFNALKYTTNVKINLVNMIKLK